jgi:hypothetical protein
MLFSFLNPWLWLGAFALGAPIWLHLRRKRESNVLQFSAIRFLEDQAQPKQSPLRLRDVLLFALRALALLLIVAAFAWPYLRGADAAPIKESRVYILDNTLSHQANSGFSRDLDRVVKEVGAAGPNIQIAVVELTANPRVVVGFGEDRGAAVQSLKKLEPSFQRGSYLAAFRQANSLLADSLGVQKRIVFLGDNQENQWHENVNTPPFLRDAQIDLPRTTVPKLPNLSLSEARAQRIFLGDKSLITFTVKLRHQGEARTANLLLRANDQVILNRTVELDKQPETVMLQAQWEADPGSWLRGEAVVDGTPDALPADNRVFFSLGPVVEGKVALLAQSSYLRLALSPDVMRGQWAMRPIEPAALTAELGQNQDADVLCLESNYLQSAEARKLLWRYLTNGRGVILLVNRITPSIAGFLRELGFESEGEVQSAQGGSEKFQYVFLNHPIFHPFLSSDFGNLLDIRISKYFRLKTSQALPLIFSEKGAPLFFQGTKQKLFVLAFGLDREHTSWPVHQTFIPFLDLCLQAARAEDPTPTNFEPGEVAQVQLPGAAFVREVVLRGANGNVVSRVAAEQGRAQIRVPASPGLYSVTYDDSSRIEKVLSVNPPPKESELDYAESPETLKVWQIERPMGTEKWRAVPAAQGSRTGILQQRIWWWMLIAGLAALMVEMMLVAAGKTGILASVNDAA